MNIDQLVGTMGLSVIKKDGVGVKLSDFIQVEEGPKVNLVKKGRERGN